MTKNFNTNTENKDEWLTPPYIIESLGKFDLDPCAPVKRPWDTASSHFCKDIDGLKPEWFGRVWLNPPYGRETFKWLNRLAQHGNGIALIYARTDTKGFHREIWQKADAITLFFFKGRLRFYHVDGTLADNTAGAPSCLVAYGENNVEAIRKSGLKGKLIEL